MIVIHNHTNSTCSKEKKSLTFKNQRKVRIISMKSNNNKIAQEEVKVGRRKKCYGFC